MLDNQFSMTSLISTKKAFNIRFSDIWAEELKSRIHIANQLQFRLNESQMNDIIYLHLLYLYSATVRADVFQISIHQKALDVVCKFFFAAKQILNDIYNSTLEVFELKFPDVFLFQKSKKKPATQQAVF